MSRIKFEENKIKRGDERLYYNGDDILNVEVLSARRKKYLGINGREYRIRMTNRNYVKGADYRHISAMEFNYWQPDGMKNPNLW